VQRCAALDILDGLAEKDVKPNDYEELPAKLRIVRGFQGKFRRAIITIEGKDAYGQGGRHFNDASLGL